MTASEIHIKNMVCDRCVKAVAAIMTDLGYPAQSIKLGSVLFSDPIEIDRDKLRQALNDEGFDLVGDDVSKIINKIKTLVIAQIHHYDTKSTNLNLSDYLEKEIGKSYSYLSTLFSKTEGRTIEKYAIQQRIERVKELLIYGEKTISEIAWELGYSSSQYLSNQFKAETGLTPSSFRKLIDRHRTSIDQV
ncbi:MAG TPA: AraC family transcriptional regulator [Balneolaceae bacterium]|nr:AraC family transcriptional regulator [Balneolaceae bacterium]